MKIITRRYARARDEIFRGDLLLYRRGRGPVGWVIGAAGRSTYSHAAMLDWGDYPSLQVLEMRAAGGRVGPLAPQVDRYPGRIDVYRTNAQMRTFDRSACLRKMYQFTRRRYGWWNLLRVALLHLPVVRMFVAPETDDQMENGHPPFCSQAIAAACRAGGVDPVPNLADRLTEPGDLARSRFFDYLFTLIP